MNKLRIIRSFANRQRKLHSNKQKLFDDMWKKYGMGTKQGMVSMDEIFGSNAPIILEIGFGDGHNLLEHVLRNSNQGFVGIEVYKPGIVTLFSQLQLKGPAVENLRIYNEDAVLVLKNCIQNKSLSKILIFFPDPWPKRRHQKRRLIQPEFLKLVQEKLKSDGVLHIATDWEDYAQHILNITKNNKEFILLDKASSYKFISERMLTKFEERGKRKGNKIFDLVFIANCNHS